MNVSVIGAKERVASPVPKKRLWKDRDAGKADPESLPGIGPTCPCEAEVVVFDAGALAKYFCFISSAVNGAPVLRIPDPPELSEPVLESDEALLVAGAWVSVEVRLRATIFQLTTSSSRKSRRRAFVRRNLRRRYCRRYCRRPRPPVTRCVPLDPFAPSRHVFRFCALTNGSILQFPSNSSGDTWQVRHDELVHFAIILTLHCNARGVDSLEFINANFQ